MKNTTDWLDDLLESSSPYIEDDGFTESVVARLPEPRKSFMSPGRLFVLLVAAATVGLLVDGGRSYEMLRTLGTFWQQAPLPLAVALITVAALAWAPLTIAFEED